MYMYKLPTNKNASVRTITLPEEALLESILTPPGASTDTAAEEGTDPPSWSTLPFGSLPFRPLGLLHVHVLVSTDIGVLGTCSRWAFWFRSHDRQVRY